VSKERVRQIENRALAKLKSVLLERYPDAAPFVR
jgi:DNA-directed RNA polymerase sigma subunit (sigma70/sigma32)